MNIIPKLFASLSLSFLLIALPTTSSLSPKCHPQDKKVLKQILKAIAIPEYFKSGTTNTPCCDWYGAYCDPDTGRVISFAVYDEPVVKGKIPEVVGDLPALTKLVFRNCPNLTGPIPQSVTKLTNLSMLWLSSNRLSGPVPSYLSKLKKLEYINLSYNKFSGSIPASLSQLPKLDSLRLNSNKLTGTIPESLGNLALQSYILIGENQLTGNVPRSFGNANFYTLDFSNNKLEGDLSFLFGKKKTLQTADFSRNMFEFDLSKVAFSENLIYLDLNHNKIYGSLPAEMTKLKLQTFNVSYNMLCGKIPVGGSMQTYEQTSYFHNRCLCGAPLTACK